jgi:archaellin
MFLVAAVVATVSVGASLFLREVPLTSQLEVVGERVEAAA